MDLTQNWWGKHFEKVVLAVCLAATAGAIVFFVVLRENKSDLREDVANSMEDIRGVFEGGTETDFPMPEAERKALGLDGTVPLADFAQRLRAEPEAWPALAASPFPVYEKIEAPEPKVPEAQPPARIVAVEDLQAVQGRGVTTDKVDHSVEDLPRQGMSDILWVSVAGRFDLTEQANLNRAGARNVKGFPVPLRITDVEVQRRVKQGDGSWGPWITIERAMATPVKAALATIAKPDPNDPKAVQNWYNRQIFPDPMQGLIRRPPLPKLEAGSGRIIQEVTGAVAQVAKPRPAPKRTEAGTPEEPEDETAGRWGSGTAGAGPTGTAKVEPEHVYATIWAHDIAIQPRQTYQYRMRVAIFNPVYGYKNVKPAEATRQLTFWGEWSEPGPAITVDPVVEFFFASMYGGSPRLELHRWIHGQWVIVENHRSRLGAPIVATKQQASLRVPGQTGELFRNVELNPGVLLLDVVPSFRYQPLDTNRPITTSLLIFSAGEDELGERIRHEDVAEASRKRLDRKNVAPTLPAEWKELLQPKARATETAKGG